MSVARKVTVQHYLCPATEGTELTHHLAPESPTEGLFEQVCVWCHRSEDDIRADINANGGELHPEITGAGRT